MKKTKDQIKIVCDKPGYASATLADQSGMAAAAAADVLLPVLGTAVDSASGADNKYDSPVNLTLAKEAAPPPAPTQAAAPAQPIYYLVYPGAAGQAPQAAMPVAPPGYALVPLGPAGTAAQGPVGAAPAMPMVVAASTVMAAQSAAAPAAAAPAAAAPPSAQLRVASAPLYPVDVHTGSGGQVMHLQTGYLQAPAGLPAQAAVAQGAAQ